MEQRLSAWAQYWLALAESLDWLAPLLMRIYFGYFWIETGWGKIQNLDAFTHHFVEWGIPYPHFSAVLSGYTEYVLTTDADRFDPADDQHAGRDRAGEVG
jgi:putative oxidoreductase